MTTIYISGHTVTVRRERRATRLHTYRNVSQSSLQRLAQIIKVRGKSVDFDGNVVYARPR